MPATLPEAAPPSSGFEQRRDNLFQDARNAIHTRTDRLFAKLMFFQWLAGIAAAIWIAPLTRIGVNQQTHLDVLAAIFLGGIISGFPIFLAWKKPGEALTRHVIAMAQMLTSALLVYLTGGRTETHFHVFGSLAFLAFYRDWRVLLTATIVVVTDHLTRGLFWPQSFGTLTTSSWRWVEHAGWVAFENTFLLISIRQSLREMLEVAARRARMETVNAEIENRVTERTCELSAAHRELRASEKRFATAFENAAIGMAWVSPEGRWLKCNRALCHLIGYSAEELRQKTFQDLTHPGDLDNDLTHVREMLAGTIESYQMEKRYFHKQGHIVWALLSVSLVRDAQGAPVHFISQIQDITQRKQAEEKLEDTNKELIEVSRQAGMAEVATGVLHNVGNVLNSVNVASTCVADSLRKSKAANLGKVVTMLREQKDLGAFFTNDPKGRQIPGYLAQLAESLATDQSVALKELAGLQKNIEHIKDVVATQQSFAKSSGAAETIHLHELVEDALRMNSSSLVRHDIQLVTEFESVPQITVEKHKVLQVLVNLVSNAKHACDAAGHTDKRLTIRVARAPGGVSVQVSDNGIGIPPENLERIFQHGFTTKKDGHGFGLHSGAMAARQLGGTLTAHSEGTGRGATFVLELPLPPSHPTSTSTSTSSL